MSTLPLFFEKIREGAAKRWDQLENDPDLAGPWHQLFKQVQSPRHILSELLQNADDAGATEASVGIHDSVFVFEHNGEDFVEEHFASLCRFGYSNKRALHTIGFRGIGFKSTFSLGDRVELYTPTLSVFFHKKRFTEPCWINEGLRKDGKTCIRVAISDQHRQREVEKNLEEWLNSPVSLLFFKHIRLIRIGEKEVHWGSLGPGPVPDSEWMAMHEKPDEVFLLIRSAPEPFPDEALAEIRQERMLGIDEDAEFPPCKIEIVVGAKGRLFVVLPTGVETEVPFACNAPFIQDPARVKIKDTETSPTNRWLLERAGKLAASSMLAWLQQNNMTEAERARAYGLFPDVDRSNNSLEGACGTIVEESFEEGIADHPFLLTNTGVLTLPKQSIILPEAVFSIWSPEQVAVLLDDQKRPALSQYIDAAGRQKLLNWGFVEEITREYLLRILQIKHLPQPRSWAQLLRLWTYMAPLITDTWRPQVEPTSLRIVPVQGKDVLYSAAEVLRLGEKKLLHSENDWQFLADYLIVLNQNWPRFLAEQRRISEEGDDSNAQYLINAAYAVLKKIGLDDTSDVSKVIDRVAAEFFAQENVTISFCIQLAQISAKLGVTITDRFQYVTLDCYRRSIDDNILFDVDGTLEEYVPEEDRTIHLLHHDYTKAFTSCTAEEWHKWVMSGRSGLFLFVPFFENYQAIYGRDQIQNRLRIRGLQGEVSFQYVTNHFVITDWDFVDSYWRHWENISVDDHYVWGQIAERILAQPESFWSAASNARAFHIATNRSKSAITREPLLPTWILRLRELPCLPDAHGFYHKPGDLLRRTPETEALMDVEPFVHGRLDREATRPLLDLLGVRSTPTGPDRLLDCLRALSKAEDPPIPEVEKWYRRLDQLINDCSVRDILNITQAFQSEKLILTASGTWTTSKAVFLSSDEEDAPGVDVIRSSVEYLPLWRRINVAERPTEELVIQWLKGLPSGQPLAQDDARRVNALLRSHPLRIWEECGHWLNLAVEWVPVCDIEYSLSMQSLFTWKHLHEWVKQKTANLQFLSNETVMSPPFSALKPLASVIEERLHRDPRIIGEPERKPWLATLGEILCRIELSDSEETGRIRTLASDLASTDWQNSPGLEMIPYLKGTPAGTPRRADVIWLGRVLYIDGISKAKLARRVPEEIGRHFNQPDIKDALVYSFDRSTEDILAYMEENFRLLPPQVVTQEDAQQVVEYIHNKTTFPEKSRENGQQLLEIDTQQPESETEILELESSQVHESGRGQEMSEPAGDEPVRSHRPEKHQKPSIIEMFAQSQGFRKDSDERFFRSDGSWLAKTSNGARFPWELRSADGSLISYYWPKDHCLEQHPLQLDADIWGLIDTSPNIYTLVLADADGKPVAMPGTSLRQLKEEGKLKLYPATYRLVVENN